MFNYDELYDTFKTYNGPHVIIIATGGGMSIADIARIPGASNVFDLIHVPYNFEYTKQLLPQEIVSSNVPAVSKEVAEALVTTAANKWDEHNEKLVISCTAALTTNRWRRGDNHAWIAFKKPDTLKEESFHVELIKFNEEEYSKLSSDAILRARIEEDQVLTRLMLDIILGIKERLSLYGHLR